VANFAELREKGLQKIGGLRLVERFGRAELALALF
jgi:hypothetical protein